MNYSFVDYGHTQNSNCDQQLEAGPQMTRYCSFVSPTRWPVQISEKTKHFHHLVATVRRTSLPFFFILTSSKNKITGTCLVLMEKYNANVLCARITGMQEAKSSLKKNI